MNKIPFGEKKIETPAICVSVIGEDVNQLNKGVQEAIDREADIAELRIDKLKNYKGWKSILSADIPLIITNRTSREGGYFKESERKRVELLLKSISVGVSCVDIEFSTSKSLRNKVLQEAKKNGTSTICSFHDFKRFPDTDRAIKMAEKMTQKSDFGKIIGFAKTYQDSLKSIEFLIKSSKSINEPIISFAMGEKGKFTRLVSPLLNSPIVYASIDKKTAPGQLNLSNAKKMLRKFQK
ncbi:MAG: type I 3-dehydroquinate dehydratase [Candidatus Hadarchaeota archaeon]